MKKIAWIVAFALIAIVVLSGCVQTAPDTSGTGGGGTTSGGTGTTGVKEAELSGVKLSIADVTFNDNRDQVTEIRVLVTPLEASATRTWSVKPSLEKDGIKEITYTAGWSLPRLEFSNVTSPSKVTLKGFYGIYAWDPKYARTGDYTLVLEIVNPNTEEVLATISKPVKMDPNAPKVQ